MARNVRFVLISLVVVVLIWLIFFRKRDKPRDTDGSTATPITPPVMPTPQTTPQQQTTQQQQTTPTQSQPSKLRVHSIRFKARDGQTERGVVCSEVKLLSSGKWLRPVSGSVTTVAPGHKGDWRILDDNSNGSYVHTDVTSAGNAITLNYGGVEADALAVWVRTDYLNSGMDHMFNVDVEVIGENNQVIWRKQLNRNLFSETGKSYSLDFITMSSDG